VADFDLVPVFHDRQDGGRFRICLLHGEGSYAQRDATASDLAWPEDHSGVLAGGQAVDDADVDVNAAIVDGEDVPLQWKAHQRALDEVLRGDGELLEAGDPQARGVDYLARRHVDEAGRDAVGTLGERGDDACDDDVDPRDLTEGLHLVGVQDPGRPQSQLVQYLLEVQACDHHEPARLTERRFERGGHLDARPLGSGAVVGEVDYVELEHGDPVPQELAGLRPRLSARKQIQR